MSENGNGTAGELDAKELKTKIQAILKDADLETTSAKKVRTQLEEDLGGKDLSDRKEEINKIIKEVMDEMEEDEDEEEDEEEEEEAAASDEEDGSDEDYSEEEKPKKKSPAKRSPAAAPKRSPAASAKRATPKKSYAESDDSEAQEKSDDPSDDDEEEENESEDDSDGARRPNKGRAKPVAGVVRGKKKKDEDAHSSDFSMGSEDGETSDGGGDSDYAPDAMASSLKKKAKAKAKAGGRGRGRGRGKKRKANSDDSSDESSGEEWGKKKKSAAKKRKNAYSDDSDADSDASAKPKKKRGGGGGGGFTKPQNLSEELADIVGKDQAPRHEVVKQVWAYIKENKLQDPKNKQFAKCDDKLMKVIGVKKFRCFGMAKFLKDHMTPT